MLTENITLIFITGKTGKYTKCGKDAISVEKLETSHRISYDLKCSECGATTHIDGIDKSIELEL